MIVLRVRKAPAEKTDYFVGESSDFVLARPLTPAKPHSERLALDLHSPMVRQGFALDRPDQLTAKAKEVGFTSETFRIGDEMPTKKNGAGNLKSALAQLIQNQAQFVGQLAETNKRLAQSDEKFGRIEKDLDLIKALLLQHEDTLKKMAEAIREKIGFKAK